MRGAAMLKNTSFDELLVLDLHRQQNVGHA
jgi:hypothetical protein